LRDDILWYGLTRMFQKAVRTPEVFVLLPSAQPYSAKTTLMNINPCRHIFKINILLGFILDKSQIVSGENDRRKLTCNLSPFCGDYIT